MCAIWAAQAVRGAELRPKLSKFLSRRDRGRRPDVDSKHLDAVKQARREYDEMMVRARMAVMRKTVEKPRV